MTSRPSLLIISLSRIVSDPRVLKQVNLFRDIYEVSTCGIGPAPEGVTHHFEIPGDLRAWADDQVSLLSRRYGRAYWGIQAVAAARRVLPVGTFDGILANDVNTLPLALSLAPKHGVHLDAHEYSPSEKEDDLKWRVFVAPFVRWICRRFLPQVVSATTVSSGIAHEYKKVYGTDFGVVTNAAPYAEISPRAVDAPIRIVSSGAAQRYRNIEHFISVMEGLAPEIELDLMLVANEPEYLAELKVLGSSVRGLRFRDPVPYAQLVETVSEYDVAITFLPPTTFNLANALPNKFFEAVQARVAQVIGPSPEMQRILTEYDLGIVTKDFEVDSLRDVLASLTPADIDRWKASADRAARALSSEEQEHVWSDAIRALLGQ